MGDNPYPGLRPFDQDESEYFFGREEQTGQIQKRLQAHHIAAVLGGSGSGKSSLIRAGVIPNLRTYGLEGAGDFWIPVVFTPQISPIHRLAVELDAILEPPPAGEGGRQGRIEEIVDLLEYSTGLSEFRDTYRDQIKVEPGLEALRGDVNILVLADQFEEVFRPHTDPRTRSEVRQLVDLVVETHKHPVAGIYLILTMRTEDLHRCAAFLELPVVLNECAFLARRLKETEFRNAMVNPAVLMQARDFVPLSTDDGDGPFTIEVLKSVYDDLARHSADPDQLPLLQHFLFKIWEAACERCRGIPPRITEEDLATAVGTGHPAAGGLLSGCIENAADKLYTSLTSEQKNIASAMFKLLAEVDDSGVYKRRWTTRREIAAVAGLEDERDPDLEVVIEKFRSPHPYLRVEGGDAAGVIDVFHEALLRNWPRFGRWISEERLAERAYLRLVDSYQYWKGDWQDDTKSKWRRWYVHAFHVLGRRGLIQAKDTKVLEKPPSWAARYGAGDEVPESETFQRVVAYARRSERQSWLMRWGSIAVVVAATVVAGQLLLEMEKSNYLALEKRIFQPFAVAAAIDPPNMQSQPSESIEPGLWEVAAALRTLQVVQRDDMPNYKDDEDRNKRLWRSESLAELLSHRAARTLLDGYLWPIEEDKPRGKNASTRLLTGKPLSDNEKGLLCHCGADVMPGCGSSPLGDEDRQRANKVAEKARVFTPNADIEIRKLPYPAPDGNQFKVFQVSETLCFLTRTGDEWSRVLATPLPPGTKEIDLDPALRLYVSRGETQSRGKTKGQGGEQAAVLYQAFLVPLEWYRNCPDGGESSCIAQWFVRPRGVTLYVTHEERFDFYTNKIKTDAYEPLEFYEARSQEREESLQFYNTAWKHRFQQTEEQAAAWVACEAPESVAAVEERQVAGSSNSAEIITELFECDDEETVVSVERARRQVPPGGTNTLRIEHKLSNLDKVPVAELVFMGPHVEKIELSEPQSSEAGENIEGRIRVTANDNSYVATWGRADLLDGVCAVLELAGWEGARKHMSADPARFSIVAETFRALAANDSGTEKTTLPELWKTACPSPERGP